MVLCSLCNHMLLFREKIEPACVWCHLICYSDAPGLLFSPFYLLLVCPKADKWPIGMFLIILDPCYLPWLGCFYFVFYEKILSALPVMHEKMQASFPCYPRVWTCLSKNTCWEILRNSLGGNMSGGGESGKTVFIHCSHASITKWNFWHWMLSIFHHFHIEIVCRLSLWENLIIDGQIVKNTFSFKSSWSHPSLIYVHPGIGMNKQWSQLPLTGAWSNI